MKTVVNSFHFVGICYFCKTITVHYLCYGSAAILDCLKYCTLT